MLLQLDIKNYAIIEAVSIHFSDDLNVITGETGAGKSILLEALSLILGVRAGNGVLRDKNKKAIIEGVFRLPKTKDLSSFFRQNELDYAAETILRREINPSGKSRNFINDTPVKLRQLTSFSTMLVDLHQQFDTLQLGRSGFQLLVLDLLASQKKLLEAYQKKYRAYAEWEQKCSELEKKAQRLSLENDYTRFLFRELEEAGFAENELEELAAEMQTISHTEDLKTNLEAANQILGAEDSAIIGRLRLVQNQLSPLSAFQKSIPALLERLSSVQIELQDITDELQQINEAVEYDGEQITIIQDRINLGYKLLKKHQLQTTEELLALKDSLKQELNESENVDAELQTARKETEKQLIVVRDLAEKLTKGRQDQIQPFVLGLHKLLKRVGMPNARMKVLLSREELTETGQDKVSFEFDANKSGQFLPIRNVASGGELSRLMLCIKSMIAHSATLPTLIFDEIESGISGEAAKQVGLLLRELAVSHQVICISHQPQVAAKAQTHFQVVKKEKKGQIITEIEKLPEKERIRVIAGMLSGDQPTSAALTNAKELMEK